MGQAAANVTQVRRERDEYATRNAALASEVQKLQAQVATLELNSSDNDAEEFTRLKEFEARILAATQLAGNSTSRAKS